MKLSPNIAKQLLYSAVVAIAICISYTVIIEVARCIAIAIYVTAIFYTAIIAITRCIAIATYATAIIAITRCNVTPDSPREMFAIFRIIKLRPHLCV